MLHNWKQLVCVAGGVLTAAAAHADTTVLIQDGFGDGDRNNDMILDGVATNPADTGAAWHLIRNIGDYVLTVADDTGGFNQGSALDVISTTNSTRPIGASFPPTTLEQDGDRIRVRLWVRATESPIDPTDAGTFPDANGDRRFRFGLYNSNGTPFPEADTDDQSFTDDDTGYLALLDVGPDGGNTYSAFGDKADGILGGSSVPTGTTATDPDYRLKNTPSVVELILTRAGDDVLLAITYDGELAEDGVAEFADDIQPFNLPYTFDYVAFGTSGASVDYRVDQVLVDFTRPDTTAPLADGFGDNDFNNDGIADGPGVDDAEDTGFRWFRSTGTSSFDVALVDESAGIGSGNALNPFSLTTSTRAMSAAIEPIELAADGDFVRFGFDIRGAGFLPDSDRRFRFGIHNDGGTPVVADGFEETRDDPGYMVQLDTGTAEGSTATVRGDLPNGLLSGSTRSLGGTSTDPAHALTGNDTHRFEIEVRRRFDADLGMDVNDVTLYVDGEEATSGTDDGDGDPAPLASVFNQISFGTSSLSFLDYRVDNVEITTNVGVEPVFATEDGFEDGDRENDGFTEGDVNDASDTGFAWFHSKGSSSFETDIVNDDAGIGTANALNLFSLTTSGRAVSAPIEPVSLAAAGDSVTMAFDLRLRGAIPSSDRRLRFGIHNDGGTPVNTDGNDQSGDDFGYMVQFDTGASAADTVTIRGDLANGLISGSTRATGGTSDDAAFALDDNDTHRIELRVERAFSDDLGYDVNLLTLTFDGVIATEGVDDGDGAGDNTPVTYDFNQLTIGTNGVAFVDMVLDNVEITTDAGNPCIADVAAPFGVLDLTDITTFVGAFTSQDPLADVAAPEGVFDLADLNAFVAAFAAGCP